MQVKAVNAIKFQFKQKNEINFTINLSTVEVFENKNQKNFKIIFLIVLKYQSLKLILHVISCLN